MSSKWIAIPAPVVRRVRAYFAPVDRSTQTPVVFDPAELGTSFSLDTPLSPWISLGGVSHFTRKSQSRSSAVMTGIPATVLEQVRETVQAQVSFEFEACTKLTMALATGAQHMNLLAPASGSAASANGGTGVTAVAPQSGSTATSIVLTQADAALFSAGDIVAVDADYSGQTGFVGTPISGAYVKQALTDVDYVRRVTFNIGLVTSVTTSGLTLDSELPAGTPADGQKVQQVLGFVDREGGSFYQEWSALFVMEGSQGERLYFHYPRLQTMVSAEESSELLEAKHKDGWSKLALKAQFVALPVVDLLDGESVVCYRSFIPAPNAQV